MKPVFEQVSVAIQVWSGDSEPRWECEVTTYDGHEHRLVGQWGANGVGQFEDRVLLEALTHFESLAVALLRSRGVQLELLFP